MDFPWEQLTGEPLIYASMGTILNGRVDVFRTIIAAAAKNKNLQLVLSIGDQIDPKQIGSAPNNAIIVRQAPQLELLKQATVCITHAGLNTALESLAQGVPQLAIPVTYDQPGVAARIAHHKTGVVTSLDKLTPEHLALRLEEVLTNPIYRENAGKFQKAIIEAKGLSVAADLIEESLGASEKTRVAPGYVPEGKDSSNFIRFQNQITVHLTGQPPRIARRGENIPASTWSTIRTRNCQATAQRKVK